MKVSLFIPLELSEHLVADMNEHKKESAPMLLWILTQYYKDRLHPDEYKMLNERYSLTSKEMRAIKQEERDRHDSKEDRKTEELREEIARCELRLKQKEGRPEYWQTRLKQAKDNLEIRLKAKRSET